MINKSYPRFLIVWAGQLFSGLGTSMTAFALGVSVFEQTNSAAGFALVMLSLFLPSILLVPMGGVLADRYDRRYMIVMGDAGSAAAVVFLLGCLLSGQLSLWKIYLGVSLGSAFTALQGPAYKASISDLLSESQFAKAGGLIQLASASRHLVAPIAAGFIISFSGIKTVFILDIATFFVAVVAAFSIPKRERKMQQTENPHLIKEVKEGWACLSDNPGVTQVVFKLAAVTFFAGCVQTLFTPMMLSLTNVKTLGTIQSISAMGMLAGSLLISILGLRGDTHFQLRLGLLTGGLTLALMGISTNLLFITIFFFLFYLCLPLINTSADVLIRTEIPNEKQGRIWGITGFLTQTGYIAAYLSAGFISDSIGRVIGSGTGRGSALILSICGLGLILTSVRKPS